MYTLRGRGILSSYRTLPRTTRNYGNLSVLRNLRGIGRGQFPPFAAAAVTSR